MGLSDQVTKKQLAIGAGIALLAGMAGAFALDSNYKNQRLGDCNSGDLNACQELPELFQPRITNREHLALPVISASNKCIENPWYCKKLKGLDQGLLPLDLKAKLDTKLEKRAAAKKKAEAEIAAAEKKRADLKKKAAEQKAAAAAQFKAEGWWEAKAGIFMRWCDGEHPWCPGPKSDGYSDYTWRAMVWCKETACGNIYAKMNILNNGVVVGWTNDSAYGGYGQKVVLTFGSSTQGSGRIVDFSTY